MPMNLLDNSDFGAAGLSGPSEISCDLILRRASGSFTPVIFVNKSLPGIFRCIAKELTCLQAEQHLTRRLYGVPPPCSPGPLTSWYRSILGNIFRDTSHEYRRYAAHESSVSSFCLVGEIYSPMSTSSYQCVTLTLPPLWQDNRKPAIHTEYSPLYGIPAQQAYRKRILYRFLFLPDNGIWYVLPVRHRARQRLLQYDSVFRCGNGTIKT